MLWESGSNSKDESEEGGWRTSNNAGYPTVTPFLVPAQSGTRPLQQNVPVVVPDVEELKEQFQQQQNMLTQIKATIKENESQLSSKGKKIEAYANRLSQIKARAKNNEVKNSSITTTKNVASPVKTITKKSSKENLTKYNDQQEKDKTVQSQVKLSPQAKIGELKRKLQESKQKFEERTGKEVLETKKIESIVENLRMQLEEYDVTIQELQKIVEQPPVANVKSDNSLRKSKSKADGRTNSSKSTQTTRLPQNEESTETIALQNRIYELESNVLDLEESLKEKQSVIDARTQAVTLVSQDLSIKEKNAIECLEETRQEMRSMQNNFVIIENQLKKELIQKDDELTFIEDKLKKLEAVNLELSSKNNEFQEKIIHLEKKYTDLESESKFMSESIVQVQNDDKVAELSNKITILNKELDDSNKSMIKMKLEHKNKIKSLNKIIEMLTEKSDDKAEILRLQTLVDEFEVVKESLQNKIAELEEEKGNHLLSILDVDDFKASEKKLKDTINQLESQIGNLNTEIENKIQIIKNLEKEKFDMFQSSQDQSILIENLYAKIQNLESENFEKDTRLRELDLKLGALENDYKIRIEKLNAERKKELETLESCYGARMAGGDRTALEEYRITNELNNVQVEEQIELLIREKQQLLEKLKSLSGVTSTDLLSLEHSEFKGQSESTSLVTKLESTICTRKLESGDVLRRETHLQEITDEQQSIIIELQNSIKSEKSKALEYQQKIKELEELVKNLEQVNTQLKRENIDEGHAAKTSSNSNVKNKIKRIQAELIESRKTIQQQNDKLQELNIKLEEKEQLIKNYIERIELFEKDDWNRDNDWKTTQDDFEHVQELQKKCLSLENSLIELTEDCERLRKENIEIVHLLSEEKVKRKKMMEKLNLAEYITTSEHIEANREIMNENVEMLVKISGQGEWAINDLEERVIRLIHSAETLEYRLLSLETNQTYMQDVDYSMLDTVLKESQEKLEWFNIVLTSKETEIFKLQNVLEDSSKTIEDLQRDLIETKQKLEEKSEKINEMIMEIERKEKQIGTLTENFAQLQDSMNLENQRTSSNELQLKQLMETVKHMECDAAKKESELKNIQDILAVKNIDIHNLKQWLEQVDNNLLSTYKEHLETMDKCLHEKEIECERLLTEKNALEESQRNLISINEDIANQRLDLSSKNSALLEELKAKDNFIEEMKEKLNEGIGKDQSQDSEELKVKIKKLAANLKKKVQNEKDLLQQIKDYEEFLAEKEKSLQKLQQDFTEVNEKWAMEVSEKEQFKNELAIVLSAKSGTDAENADLKEKLKFLESDFTSKIQKEEYKLQQMETQLQKMYENSERMRLKEERDKTTISNLEKELANVLVDNQKENEELKKCLAENFGKYEDLRIEKVNLDTELDQLRADNARQQAKIQELLAVIESLEGDLTQTRERLISSEERLCFLEERRSSLESKTEEMVRKIEEHSKNAATMDDLSNQILVLSESERNLKVALKNSDEKIKELTSEITELNSEKVAFEKDLNDYRKKLNNLQNELDMRKEMEEENAETMAQLSGESERAKRLNLENVQKSAHIENLKEDIGVLEAALKENAEKSKAVEKSLNQKIEELLSENTVLTERINALSEAKENDADVKPVKRKKSVTFRTDETDYIRDLKSKMHEYSEALKSSKEEIKNLEMELFREKLRSEVTEVVTEAKEKVESLRSTPEKNHPTFDATTFFDVTPAENIFLDIKTDETNASNQENTDQSIDYDSLMWDDGWGTDGHLEEQYLSTQAQAISSNINEEKLKAIEFEKQKLEEELQLLQGKFAKALKKMKEQKIVHDKLQTEINRLKSDAEFGGLDGAIMEELKSQINSLEQRERELLKNLDTAKTEKEAMQKRIEMLSAKEVKDRQDSEIGKWEMKNQELLMEIHNLQDQLRKLKEEAGPIDEDKVIRELKNKIEGLEWDNCELKELLEEKMEQLEKLAEEAEKGKTNTQSEKESSEMSFASYDEKSNEIIAELQGAKNALENIIAEERKKNEDIITALQKANKELETKIDTGERKIHDVEIELKNVKENMERMLVEKEKNAAIICDLQNSKETLEKMLAEEGQKTNSIIADLKGAKQEIENLLAEEKKKSEVIAELEQKLAALVTENETLQEILSQMKSNESVKNPSPIVEQEPGPKTKIFDYFKTALVSDVFSDLANQQAVVEPLIERKVAVPAQTSVDTVGNELDRLRKENGYLQQQLIEAQSVAETIKKEREEIMAKYRSEYESALEFHLEGKNKALQHVHDLEKALTVKAEELNSLSARVKDLDETVNTKTAELLTLSKGRQELEQAFDMKTEESSNMWLRISELEQLLVSKTEEAKMACARKAELEGALSANGEQLNNAMQKVSELEETVRMREDEGLKILAELVKKTEEICSLSSRVLELEGESGRLSSLLENTQKMNDSLIKAAEDNSPELESLNKLLNEERANLEIMKVSLKDKEESLQQLTDEITVLRGQLADANQKLAENMSHFEKQRALTEEYCEAKEKLEDLVENLQTELQTANIELDLSRKEVDELQKKLQEMADFGSDLNEEIKARVEKYERDMEEKAREEVLIREEMEKVKKASEAMEIHIETLKSELKVKDNDIFELSQTLDEEQKQLTEMRALLEEKDTEITDLKNVLTGFQEEISSFRNFEKQIKELRVSQIKQNSPEAEVTADGDPDFTNWTEHELAELNMKLQSDLDTALYMLHQRDIRCDELTFELMQLLEERDTLQLRLSKAIRLNEELRAITSNEKVTIIHDSRNDNKDLIDQSNDRQGEKFTRSPGDDLQELAQKISELHSIGYIKDKTIQDERIQRHRDQMTLLGRVSDTELGRDVSQTSANWIRTGKPAPKVMHI